MSGMNSGVNVNDPVVIAAFKSALLHQGLIALLIFGLVGLAWITVRAWWPAAVHGDGQTGPGSSPAAALPEPAWRQVLRVGFGLLWVLDGILQAQPKMAIGLPSQVIQPSAASSPHWVQQVVNWAGTTWSSPDAGRGRSGVDPGRHRHLDAGRAARQLVPAGGPGRCGLGAAGLGIR